MIRLKRTTSFNKDFKNLVLDLDKDLESRYSRSEYQYDINITVDAVDTVVLAYIEDIAVGCGCFVELDDETVELKRMFVNPYFRGFGVASEVIDELCQWAKSLYYRRIVLETGMRQPESINLYRKHGFDDVEKFGPYVSIANSVCMGKSL
jgi:putative acetyltransferase